MSLRLAARRLGLPSATSSTYLPTSTAFLPIQQHRSKWAVNIFKGWSKAGSKSSDQASGDILNANLDDPKSRKAYLAAQSKSQTRSNSDSSNIFADEIEPQQSSETSVPQQETGQTQASEAKTRTNTALVTDPDPRSRVRWQRKKVIQMVRRGGHLTREERIAMTERSLTHKSDWIPTSTKKLVMLARQILGKNVDEAISQMQWSKKKMAREVKYHLEEARDLAIAQRGMGLGAVSGEAAGKRNEKPVKIRTKDGKWLEVEDPTRMYVAESWVGKGQWLGKEIDYKGRGRMGVIKHPKASITVVLKEEKTRMRQYQEREAKKQAEGPWVHHPNRAVHGQRPYYSW